MDQSSLSIPPGYCQCGCGEKTSLAKRANSSIGVVKGQPNRFVVGHRLGKSGLPTPAGTKRCTACLTVKPIVEFCKNRSTKDGFHSNCRTCHQASYARYKAANPNVIQAKDHRWYYDNQKHKQQLSREWNRTYREHCTQRNRSWLEAKPDYQKQRYWADREASLAHNRAYYRANIEKMRRLGAVSAAKRRAAKADALGAHTADEIRQMYTDQGGLCAYCEAFLDNSFHAEHMIPLSRGGSNDWSNIAISCASCNLAKRLRTAEEYMNSTLFGLAA